MSEIARKTILIVEDDASLNKLLIDRVEKLGHEARGAGSGAEAHAIMESVAPDLMVIDIRLPDCDGFELLEELLPTCPIIILTAFGSVDQAVRAVQMGASDYLTKPVNHEALELAVARAFETVELRRDITYWQSQARRTVNDTMVGSSPKVEEMRKLIQLYASADSPVLILGESGVGKELVARAIHQASDRSAAKFVPVDCDRSEENMIASELLGHEKGAFSGAETAREGMLRIADQGTVYLNDIAEISPALQNRILRVLETGEYRRLGGARNMRTNVRIVAATSRDLPDLVSQGVFRSELYYRLSAFCIPVPPLRERLDDVPTLASHFAESMRFRRRQAKKLSREATELLTAYHWPGNVRELRNAIERSLIMSGDEEVVLPQHIFIGDEQQRSDRSDMDGIELVFPKEPTLEEIRDTYLKMLLARHEGNRTKVAKVLGMSERNTYRLISKLSE